MVGNSRVRNKNFTCYVFMSYCTLVSTFVFIAAILLRMFKSALFGVSWVSSSFP